MLQRIRTPGPIGRLTLVLALSLVVLVGCGSMPAHSTPMTTSQRTKSKTSAPEPMDVSGQWKLIFNYAFNSATVNNKIWRPGWFGNGITGPINVHELACYNPQNLAFSSTGTISLSVTHVPSTCQGVTRPYTGALVSTNPEDGRKIGGFDYTYGVLEAEVYVPSNHGLIANWPTLMTLGQEWPQDGEDDIMEGLGGTVCFHWHSPGYAPGGDLGGCDHAFTPGWHTVEADWRPGSVTWYYDGMEVGRATKGVTSAPMYIVLANTVSGKSPALATPGVAMKVAYVRVWQPAEAQAAARAGYKYTY
jgi:beta-glucanase (GH16 family)